LDICVDGFNDINPDQSIPTTTTTSTTTTTTTIPPEVATTLPEVQPVEEVTAPVDTTTTTTAAPEAEPGIEVTSIQSHSNSVLSQYGFPQLRIDGDYGNYTSQAKCLTEEITGQSASRSILELDSEEAELFLSLSEIVIPEEVSSIAGKWALTNLDCQGVIFGEGDAIVRIMPTSSGEVGHETRLSNTPAYLYRPATENNGWHNSTSFPAPEDNPANGNMYKPIYLDGGIAIHGANNIPSEPASKGCIRLSVSDQDWLVDWLGLDDVTDTTYEESLIGLYSVITGSFKYTEQVN